jgi:hypothetical protein
MKEKIKELLKESGGLCFGEDGEELAPALVGESVDYFATLLIKECIIAIEEVKKFPITTYERDMTDAETVDKCIQAVKDKFQ